MLRGHTFIGDFSQESSKYIRAVKRLRVSAFLSASFLLIFAGIAAAGSEEQLPLPKDIHGPNDFLIGTLSAPVIRGIFKAFNGDRGHKVLYSQHFVSKGFIDERSIGKGQECRFRMAFA